jgi:hypothetical protein
MFAIPNIENKGEKTHGFKIRELCDQSGFQNEKTNGISLDVCLPTK